MLSVHQKILNLLIFLSAIAFLGAGAAPADAYEVREIGVVAADLLNLRSGAGSDYPVVKVLVKDAQVKILAHQKGWLHVDHEGDRGYVANEDRLIKLYTIHTVNDGRRTDLESAQAQAEDVRKKIADQTAEVQEYTQREQAIAQEIHQTDLALHQARRDAAAAEAELKAVADQIAELETSAMAIQTAVDQGSGYAVNRLIALYKLTRLGESNLLASATSMHDLMRRQSAIERILAHDHQTLSDLMEKKTRLQALMADLTRQKAVKVELSAAHQRAVATLAREKERRKNLLAEIKTKKDARLASIKYLKNAAIELDKTIKNLRRKSASPGDRGGQFSAYQGLLKMPVDGKVISTYGNYVEPASGATHFRNGIEIQSKHGAPVRAVFAGETIYSSWLKGYGNVIIIAHGKDFHTVYAHAEELFRAKGETVETGEVIATVGDSGSMSGPSLYFEIRREGKPVDPLEWIRKG